MTTYIPVRAMRESLLRKPIETSGLPTAKTPLRSPVMRSTDYVQRMAGNQVVSDMYNSRSDEAGEEAIAPPVTAGYECLFQLKVAGVTYCFSTQKLSGESDVKYRLYVLAPDKNGEYTDESMHFEAIIHAHEANGQRTIDSSSPTITFIGSKKTKKRLVTVTIDVPVADIEKAWPPPAPAAGADLDYAVLIVHDPKSKPVPKPWSLVFWMGKGTAPPPTKARVKWFDVDNDELDALVNNQLIIRETTNEEPLSPSNIAGLIATKTPRRESKTGFDMSTWAGYRVKTSSAGVVIGNAVVEAPFDVAAGRHFPGSSRVIRTLPIKAPPTEIEAHFVSNGWQMPAQLEATSVATLTEEFRVVLLYLHDNPEVTITIYGDTDAAGSDALNQPLSERRANEAKRFLTNPKEWPDPPGALQAETINAVGRGADLAKADLKNKNPKTWETIAGTSAAANAKFRRFVIEYTVH